ncbi:MULTISPECIES: hypothetical protein [unclassified Streptomyces]|uniref:hypothetical protein n=1 Tax=unclassified Streptomyces TaxID=2593676 RepID=UPI0033B919AD
MFVEAQLKALMRDGARGAARHEARNLVGSWRRFAAFAFVAEQYGYRYEGMAATSPKGSPNPYFGFRREADAAERATLAAARYPEGLRGGQLPGMRPGRRRLRPSPEVREEVELLHARIQVDYARGHRRRGLIQVVVLPLALLIPLSQFGFTAGPLLVCGGVWAFFVGLWGLGVLLSRRRLVKYGAVLRAADRA